MTRKDYVAISGTLSGLIFDELNVQMPGAIGWHCETLVDSLADLFEDDNPNFDRQRFIAACGFEPWDELRHGIPFKDGEAVGA